MIYTTGTIAINGNTVTGTGTNFSEPLSLIRVGCTLIAVGNPVQIFTITEIKSGTELSVTPAANPAIPAGTKFSILLSDSISVDGLAQDVAETLRYYQGKETEIAAAVEWWEEFGGDGQMDQLLASIRAETAKSTANAQKTESDKNAAAASKTAAANSATAAKASQDAAKASETAASSSKTAAATSETNAAKSAADALNYRNQAQGIVGSSIGLSSNPRDCPDISGNPSGYLGFLRIMEGAAGWPSIASGERYLSGFICQTLGSVPAFSGLFIGHITGSAYTYKWSESTGPQWTRHARKNEVDKLVQLGSETHLLNPDEKAKIFITSNKLWGAYDSENNKYIPLDIAQGGTGANNANTARTNLQVMLESKTVLDSSTNLDDLKGTSAGFYFQSMSANATADLNYPIQQAGALLVQRTGANGNDGCIQSYFVYNNPSIVYKRIYTSTQGWSAWNKSVSTERIAEGESTTYVYSKLLPEAPRIQVSASGLWGCHNGSGWVPLTISQGGTGATSLDNARTNLGLGRGNSPQLDSLFLDKISDSTNTYTSSGIIHTRLLGNDSTVRLGADMYVETLSNEPGQLTIRFTYDGSTGASRYLNLNSEGNLIVDNAMLRSTAEKPLQIMSANPAIRFNETDRPANTPTYILIANGGDWFIQKRDYDDAGSVSNAIAYNFANDRLDVTNIKASGTVTCLAVNQSSDRDLKDNIQVISNATEAIRKMNGYTYTLKENGLPYAGVIAQEVMEVLPEAVGSFTHYGEALQGPTIDGNELREETRYLNVDYAAVTGLLVQVARETDNRVTELEEENASLRDNIAAMDERIAKLEALVSKLTGSKK
ncbi:TPA: tail fiber domain-containing protein [Escherichia coli]